MYINSFIWPKKKLFYVSKTGNTLCSKCILKIYDFIRLEYGSNFDAYNKCYKRIHTCKKNFTTFIEFFRIRWNSKLYIYFRVISNRILLMSFDISPFTSIKFHWNYAIWTSINTSINGRPIIGRSYFLFTSNYWRHATIVA